MAGENTIKKMVQGLLDFDEDVVGAEAKKLIDEGGDPKAALDELSRTIRSLGDLFEKGEVALAELVIAADAMDAAMSVILPALPAGSSAKKGKILFGTVKGDIHGIGKMITGALLQASGFEVVDLGVDVTASTFAQEAQKSGADIVALAASMSTTIPAQKDVIEYFQATNIRDKFKIIVGGASCSQEWADRIGADAFGLDASDAVKVASKLMGVSDA